DIAEEEGEVPRASSGDDPDPPGGSRVGAHDSSAVRVGGPQLIGVGEQDPVDGLVDEALGVVDDLAQHALLVGMTSRRNGKDVVVISAPAPLVAAGRSP